MKPYQAIIACCAAGWGGRVVEHIGVEGNSIGRDKKDRLHLQSDRCLSYGVINS